MSGSFVIQRETCAVHYLILWTEPRTIAMEFAGTAAVIGGQK